MTYFNLFKTFLRENPAFIFVIVGPVLGMGLGIGLANLFFWMAMNKISILWFILPLWVIVVSGLVWHKFKYWMKEREQDIVDRLKGNDVDDCEY